MPDFGSSKGKIMLGLEGVILDLVPVDIGDMEVAVREDWKTSTGDPYRGVSIFDLGEQYDDGTVGTSDVGYLCGIIFAKGRTSDAILPDDKIMQWYESVRRRLAGQRLSVYDSGDTYPREHVCIVLPGKTITNPSKWPNHLIRQMVVSVWIREDQTQY